MTRKHFEALAAALKDNRPAKDVQAFGYAARFSEEQWLDGVGRVADVCARFNPYFNRARFLKACGVEEGK